MTTVNKYKVIIPVFNGGELWKECVRSLLDQQIPLKDIIVIDSGSEDGSLEVSQSAGFDVHKISKNDFNHGGTRQLGISLAEPVGIVVFLTQDAILFNKNSIENLVNAFTDSTIACAFGRQLPRLKATHLEAHARYFNYPEKSYTRSILDKDEFGIKTAFISNSFAAYRVTALNSVGGFPSDIILSEDTYVAARMLLSNWKLAYVSDAQVYHSHNYSYSEEFKRYFDIGVFHVQNNWLLTSFGKAEGEGLRFIKSEVIYVSVKNLLLLPSVMIRTLLKYAGYRLGKNESRLPLSLKKRLSMHSRYWK